MIVVIILLVVAATYIFAGYGGLGETEFNPYSSSKLETTRYKFLRWLDGDYKYERILEDEDFFD